MIETSLPNFALREATIDDVPLILSLITELAEYERLTSSLVTTEDDLQKYLFGPKRYAEVMIGEYEGQPVSYALFFHTFSTFAGKPGLYLEDVFVRPAKRGLGIGKVMLSYLAKLALERGCGRFEWTVLDWNEPAIKFYQSIGAVPMRDWTAQRVSEGALQKLAEAFSK